MTQSLWNTTTPPPMDGRTVVLIGAVFEQDEFGAEKLPVLCYAHFDAESGRWYAEDGCVIRLTYGSELQCYAWAELPPSGGKLIVLEEAEKVSAS